MKRTIGDTKMNAKKKEQEAATTPLRSDRYKMRGAQRDIKKMNFAAERQHAQIRAAKPKLLADQGGK